MHVTISIVFSCCSLEDMCGGMTVNTLPLRRLAIRRRLLMLSKRPRYDYITLKRRRARTTKEQSLILEPVAVEEGEDEEGERAKRRDSDRNCQSSYC